MQGLGLFLTHVLAIEDGDDLAAVVHGLLQQLQGHGLHILADHLHAALLQAQDVVLVDLLAVKAGIAHGIGDGGGLDVLGGLGHAALVLLQGDVGHIGDHGGHALGNGLGGDHQHLVLLQQFLGLLRCHDDVLVVGQDINGLCLGAANGRCDVLGGGVHGLSADDHLVHGQILKQRGQPVAGGHGHKAHFLFKHGRFLLHRVRLLDEGAVLLAHVIHLDGGQLAQLQAVLQDLARVVGVAMDLDHLQVAHHQHAVADLGELFAQLVDVFLGNPLLDLLDEGLGAVAKLDALLLGLALEVLLGVLVL